MEADLQRRGVLVVAGGELQLRPWWRLVAVQYDSAAEVTAFPYGPLGFDRAANLIGNRWV